MALLTYPIYDTIDLSTSAGVDHTLFQTGQGSSPPRTKAQTNMRGAGSFPESENFIVQGLGIHVDSSGFSDDDLQGLFVLSIVTFVYNNIKVLQMPAYKLSDLNAVSGVKTESTATAFDYFGQEGRGFMLEHHIQIIGGRPFSVEFHQGLAVDTANIELKFTMFGTLDAKDIRLD